MFDKGTVRRDFLKLSGVGAAGAVLAADVAAQGDARRTASAIGTYDVRAFGATGNGKTLDTPNAGASGGYDPPEPNQWDNYQDFGHSHWHNSLIWGEEILNVSILGPGRIWGKGLSRGAGDTALPAGVGNKAISLKNCHNVTLRDISILHGGHFAILATGVDNLTIDNLMIDTNRDAIDVDCCRNVRVSNCSVNSPWDDGICPKSSY